PGGGPRSLAHLRARHPEQRAGPEGPPGGALVAILDAPRGVEVSESKTVMPMLPRPKLSIQDVTKRFRGSRGEVHALDHVSLDVEEGEFVCLVGPSGCGKSTLLNLIAGLERPDEGRIRMGEQAVTAPGPDRMVMFQESALFPW